MSIPLSTSSLLRRHAYIGDEWIKAKFGKTFSITNPANGEHIIDVADLGAKETTLAVEAANKAQKVGKHLLQKSASCCYVAGIS